MPDNEPSWRQNAGGPKKQVRKLGWQQEDPRSAAAGGGKRAFKLFFLSVLACCAVGGIAWLIYLLWPSDRPGLLTVAADPAASADRLDHPYDPAGFLSASRLLKWADAVREKDLAPKTLSETPVWADEIDVWAKSVDQGRIDPVVIYFGLHTGTTKSGEPVVYVGRPSDEPVVDKETGGVRVKTILEKLQQYAPKKRKVLVFDNARGLPDPTRGEVYADFARAVKEKLGGQIAADNTLAVVLGAADGERGWESPDRGLTPLAHRLAAALGGKAAAPGFDSFSAEELHAYLAKEVNEWSKSNRPASQTPVLLPEPEAWTSDRHDQFRKKKFFRWDPAYDGGEKATELAGTPAKELPPAARERWEECRKLSEPPVGAPRPETYTPAAWRRYRELLLRYETACLLGDEGGAGKLQGAIADMKNRIDAGRVLPLDSSGKLAYPLAAATGQPGEAGPRAAADELDKLAGGGTASGKLLADAVAKQHPNGTKLPVEAQLVSMLNYFYAEVLKSADPNDRQPEDLARQAAKSRLFAERAALAVRTADRGFPFSERIWPLNRKTVLAGDANRRDGEDLCLAAPGGVRDSHRLAREAFMAADTEYRRADELAGKLQPPLRLRDRVLADLPFLANWVVEADLDDAEAANSKVRTAWTDAFDLADRLDRLTLLGAAPAASDLEALDTSAKRVETSYGKLKSDVEDEVKKWGGDSVWLQGKWQALEHLLKLPVPIVTADQRGQIVRVFREISANVAKEGSQLSEASKRPPGLKVVRRAKMAVAVLGSGDWGKRNETDVAASKSVLETTVSRLTEKEYPLASTAEAGAAIAANYASLGRIGEYVKKETDAADRVRAEGFARLAVPFVPPPDPEPGVAARARRWKDLLEGLAARAARDHWYDENQQPYSATVARAYLADAEKLVPAAIGQAPSDDAREVGELLKVEPLMLTCEGAGAGETLWTSETSRRLKYGFKRQDGATYPVQGHAVLWWKSDVPDLLSVTTVPRQPVPVAQKLERAIDVRTGGRIEDAAKTVKPATVSAYGFFRGQKDGLGHAARFLVNRRPDLVISDAKPEDGGLIAVRADAEFDPGAVAILLDFSGSMSEKATDDGESKVKEMRATLKQILPRIPAGTKLSIRYFVDENDVPVQKKLFPDKDRYGERLFRDCLDGPDGIFARLETIKPDGNTPLLPGMALAYKDVPDGFRGVQTVIVLTDGADTSQIQAALGVEYKAFTKMSPDETAKVRGAVQKEVERFSNWDASINMVFFGAKDEAKLAKEMFEGMEKFKTNPGKLHFAKDKQDLYKLLDTALRPKVRITRAGATVTGLPEGGIPVNRTDDSQITWWNRAVTFPIGDYTLLYDKVRQPVGIGANDRLVARLVKTARGYGFVREIVFGSQTVGEARIVGLYEAHAKNRVTANGSWNLAVPEYAILSSANSAYLVASAALEAKFETDPQGGVLRQVYPHFVWWDLARQTEGGGVEVRQPGPVFIRPITGLPAPMWQIFADADGVAEFKGSTNKLRAWAYDRPPPRFGTAIEVKPASLAAGEQSFPVGQDVVVRVSFEPVAFMPDPPVDNRKLSDFPRIPAEVATDPRGCVVVRVEDAQGRTFHARVAGGKESQFPVKEHRYFFRREKDAPVGAPQPVAAKVAGYTAAFGRISENELRGMTDLTLELVNVGDLTADRNAQNEHLLTLDLGKPVGQKLDTPEAKPSATGGAN